MAYRMASKEGESKLRTFMQTRIWLTSSERRTDYWNMASKKKGSGVRINLGCEMVQRVKYDTRFIRYRAPKGTRKTCKLTGSQDTDLDRRCSQSFLWKD
jgi:hypothetical protein